jgi:thiol-disulfide isomerase/thioredoxin
LLAAVALGAAASCSRTRVEPPPGDILADLALPMVNGAVFDPKPLYPRDVLVMFFSPSCGHCMREMPEAVAAAEKAGSAVLAVMVGGSKKQVERLAIADRLTAPVILDDGQLRRKYGIRAVPYTLVLAAGGRAERAFVGAQGEERLASALREARD